MYAYIARQPILDIDKNVTGYELLFRDGVNNFFPNIDPNAATSLILTQNHLTLGIEQIAGNLPAFINFHADTIIKNFPHFLDKEKVVIEILEDVELSDQLISACKELSEKGYALALDDHNFDPKWQVLFPFVKMIKVDISQFNILQISKFVNSIEFPHIELLAEKVETSRQFEQLKTLGFKQFQGYFFARPEMMKHKKITPTKQNLIDLIAESNKPELDLTAIQAILTRDVGLTYKLLRFINSPAYGCSQEITSLKHALIFLGDLELKKFIALLALANLNDAKPTEIIRISLARAKFCELISQSRKDNENPPKSFLTGMLSLIDGMLDSELDDVLKLLPIHEDIKQALLGGSHYLTTYLALVTSVEMGDSEASERLCSVLDFSSQQLSIYYQEAIRWADGMLSVAQSE